jgi:hypothetical protein
MAWLFLSYKTKQYSVFNDLVVYGMACEKIKVRSWYNPMRWVKGKYYQCRVNPRDMYLEIK